MTINNINNSTANKIFEIVVRNSSAAPVPVSYIQKKIFDVDKNSLKSMENIDHKSGISLTDIRSYLHYSKQQIDWIVPDDNDRIKSQEASGIVVVDGKQLWIGDSGNKNNISVYDSNSNLVQLIEFDESIENGDWEALSLMEDTCDYIILAIWDNGKKERTGAVKEVKINKVNNSFVFDRIVRVSKRPKNIRDPKEFNEKAYNVEALAYNADSNKFVAMTKFKSKDLQKKGVDAHGEIFQFKPGEYSREDVKKLKKTLFDKIGKEWAKRPTDACYYKGNYYVLCHKEQSNPRIVVLDCSFNVRSVHIIPFGYVKPEGIFVNKNGLYIADEGQAKDVGNEYDLYGRVSKSFSINISWDFFLSTKTRD